MNFIEMKNLTNRFYLKCDNNLHLPLCQEELLYTISSITISNYGKPFITIWIYNNNFEELLSFNIYALEINNICNDFTIMYNSENYSLYDIKKIIKKIKYNLMNE